MVITAIFGTLAVLLVGLMLGLMNARRVARVAKGRPYRPPPMDQRGARRAFLRGFAGMEPDTCYWDPLGKRVPGGVNLRPAVEALAMPDLQVFDDAQRKGLSPAEAIHYMRSMKKDLNSGVWNIPLWAVQRALIVTPGTTPLARLLPRVAVDRTEVQATPLTDVGEADFFDESAVAYPSNDDEYHGGTISDYTFSVHGYGRENPITDLMLMTGKAITDPAATMVQAQLTAQNRLEERQIVQGTNYKATGFLGLHNLSGDSEDKLGGAIVLPTDLRRIIDTAEKNGCDRERMVVVTGWDMYGAIRDKVETFVRYSVTGNGLSFGFRVLEFDGVPVMPSMGCNEGVGTNEIIAFDMGTTYLTMVQDATLKPLGKDRPSERMATDSYGCVTTEGRIHIVRRYNLGLPA